MAAFGNPGRTSSTSTQTSWASNPPSFALSGTPPTSTETSPAQTPSKPSKSGVKTTKTKSRPAQEPSDPTNSDIQTTNTASLPAPTPPKRKARTVLTAEQRLDRHKRAEAVRRNRIGTGWTILRKWTPPEFKLQVNKADCKKETLIAAGDWLEHIQQDNNELEKKLNALIEKHGPLPEWYLTAQTQLQQQQGLLPSPPLSLSLSPSPPPQQQQQQQQPAVPPQLFDDTPPAIQWDPITRQHIFLPPPQQPNLGYGYSPHPQDNHMVPEEDCMRLPQDNYMVPEEDYMRMT